jgi:DnaK suppressor protein
MSTAAVMVNEPEYRPSEDEEFMNPKQLEYFKLKLLTWKDEILRESRETVSHLQKETENHPDLADRASSETDRSLELRTRDRQRKLISKIDEALRRVEDGSYGYCGDRRADHAGPSGCASDRHPEPRGPGAARTPRARPPRRLGG